MIVINPTTYVENQTGDYCGLAATAVVFSSKLKEKTGKVLKPKDIVAFYNSLKRGIEGVRIDKVLEKLKTDGMMMDDGNVYKVTNYVRIFNRKIEELKIIVNVNKWLPFVMDIEDGESFSDRIGKDFILRRRMVGNHGMVLKGYDDDKKLWIVQNNWGSDWKNGGSFFLPFMFTQKFVELWRIEV